MNLHSNKTSAQTGISRHWLDLLEENHVTFMVLDPRYDTKLIEQLQSRPDWMVEFVTDDAIFFIRETEFLG